MKPFTKLTAAAVAAVWLMSCDARAAVVNLASTMNPSSFISENAATGGFGRINEGNGALGTVGANTGDADAIYNLAQINSPPGTATLFGTPVDLFPREANFQVGSLTYDESALNGSGVESAPITAIDLGKFWMADPNRTNSAPGNAPTVISDVSDFALGMWFFNMPGGISFGALDANDKVTLTNGNLTSIDLTLTTTFLIAGRPFAGQFSIAGNQISYQVNDTKPLPLAGNATLIANLTGTVNAVVPEPASCVVALPAIVAALSLRRRS